MNSSNNIGQKSKIDYFRRHRWWTGLGIVIVLVLIFILFLLPPLIRYGMEKWLESQGRLQAQVQEVDFNLFSGNIVVHSLITERNQKGGMHWGRAALEIKWGSVFKKRIRLDDIYLANALITIEQEKNGEIYVGGLRVRDADTGRQAQQETEENGWEIGFGAIDLHDVTVRYITADGTTRELIIREAQIDPFQSWNPSVSSDFKMDVALRQGTLDIQGTARPYAGQADVSGIMKINEVPLVWVQPLLVDTGIRSIDGTLAADISFSLGAGQDASSDWQTKLDGTVSLRQFSGELPQARIGPTTLNWNGTLQMAGGGDSEAAGPRIDANGSLTADGADLLLNESDLQAAAAAIRIEGEFSQNSGQAPAPAGFAFSGTAAAESIRVVAASQEITLAQVQHISLKGLSLAGADPIGAESIQVVDAAIVKRPEAGRQENAYVAELPQVGLDSVQVELQQKHIRIGSIAIRQARVILIRNKEGALELFDLLPAAIKEDEEEKKEEPSTGWTYQVSRADIEQDSSLIFRDNSVTPQVNLTLSNINAQVRELDSSEPQKEAMLSIQADLGKYSGLQAEGSMTPFADQIGMNITGEIKQFSLPEVRAYAERYWGYTIRSGQLYSDFRLRVEQAKLNSLFKLFITNLNVNRMEAAEQDEFTEQLGMPLNAALNLIRDSDDDITLQLPVTGSLASPDIGFTDVIGTALKNATFQAIKTAALSYFAPLGAVYVASKLFGRIVALRLEPVYFPPGQSRIELESKAHLDRVYQKIKDRPEARLLLCGIAVPADRQALGPTTAESQSAQANPNSQQQGAASPAISDARLLDLAETRAESVRTYLVSLGIDSERLVLCAPEIGEEGTRPRVELAI